MEQRLKPCPFCGSSKLQLLTDKELNIPHLNDGLPINGEFVYCMGCGAMIGKYAHMDIVEAQEKAILAWNRRV